MVTETLQIFECYVMITFYITLLIFFLFIQIEYFRNSVVCTFAKSQNSCNFFLFQISPEILTYANPLQHRRNNLDKSIFN